jgi:hypothetical protein
MRRGYVGSVISAVAVVAIIVTYAMFTVRAVRGQLELAGFRIVIWVIAGVVSVGILIALVQRIVELRKGQEDDIDKY